MRILLKDLQPSTDYSFQLRSLSSTGEASEWSRIFTITTDQDQDPPSPPTNLTIESVGDAFIADWDAPVTSQNGTTLVDFKHFIVTVTSSLRPGETRTFIVPESKFTLSFEQNVSTFGQSTGEVTFEVAAVDLTGNVSSSIQGSAANPPPSPVTGLVAEEVSDGIALSWNPNTTDLDFKNYEVWLSTSGASGTYTKIAESGSSSYNHHSTLYSTDHWYRVYSVDKFNTKSAHTQTTQAVRPSSPFLVDNTAPGVPTGLAGTITTTVDRAALNVSWTNGANPDNDLAGTVIGYRPVGSTDWSYTTVDYTLTSTRIENITPYVNYEMRARAYDWSANYSSWTNTITTNTAATNTAPPTVTGVAIVAGLDSVTVSWAESTADDVKNGAGVYLVQVATNNTFSTGLLEYRTGATQISVTGLAQNQTYYARVKAVDSAGLQSASWSTVVNAGTGAFPAGSTFDYAISATAPSNPDVGDIWMDTTSGFEKQWNGSNWVNTGNASIDYVDGKTDNLVKNYVTEYAVNSSETVAPTTGWSTATPTRTPGTFIWYRVVVTYGDNNTSTTSPALLTGNTGATGSAGTPAPFVVLNATSQVLTSPAGGGATSPATSVVTGTATNTTISVWEYSRNGGTFSATVPPGVSRTGNVVTITGSTMTDRTITVRMADAAGVADTMTVAKVLDGAAGSTGTPGSPGAPGADAYTVLLTNESHAFPGSTSAALAGNTTTSVVAFKGTTQQNATIGTITGQVTGLTTAISNNGTNNATVTVTVTSSLVTQSGVLTIPITVDGQTFSKRFSWSVAYTGSQGVPGNPGSDGQTFYTWIKYADTPTTGMSDSPTGKTYFGIASNKTSATESSNYADYQWSLIKGADGNDGKGISSTVVNYAKSTDGVNAPGSGWGTSIPTTTAGEFLWTRTVTTYTDASNSTAYSVAAHGATGSPGTAGVGISGTTVHYQVHTNGTTAPTGTWLTTVPATTAGQFLWTRTVTSYTSGGPTTAYSVAAHGATGQQGIPGNPGADGTTTYTWVKYADNSSGGGMSDSPTGKTYIGLAFNKTTPTESTTTTDYAWSLIQGPQGTPAPIVSLTATTQVLTSPATGGATTPTTSVVTGTATNTTITVWQYSVNGAAFSNTVPTGVSRTGNVVTITGSTMTAKTITVRMADANGVADTLTVAKVLDGATGATGDPGNPGLPGDPGDPGADAFTVLLTNESHTFPGSTTAALAGSTTTNVIAYEGATLSNATIGTITGQVTGLTTSVTGSGTTNPTITITVTTSLTTKSGTLTIPVTVNGVTFTKRFSWSLALQGSQGIQGLPGSDGTTYYTWLKYASSATPAPADMSDSPTGKTYMGIAVNKTSPTETTTYSDYTWSLIKGDQGIPGTPGDDGITYYTWIKYGTSAAGAGLSDDPTGRPYIGIAYNKTTATESTTPGDYTWSLIQGAPGSDGSDGTDGVGITSVTPYFYRITAGSAAPAKPTASPPPSPWTATEPDYLTNTELYRTERIIYTDASFAYTNVSKVSAYTAAVTAIASANGKNKVVHSTSAASGTTGYVAGDTWFRYDGSNNIIAQWRYSGSAWVSEQVDSAVIANLDAGKLTANSAFITTLNIGSGGVIQSAGYTSGGTSGFQLSNTGLTIKGTGNVVDVGAVSAGTISAKTWNVGAGGVINVDSTGQIKSNNYALNSTGYKLSNTGLEINDGSIDAKALRTNTAVIGDLTIGQSANTLGSIKSYGYVAGTTGWKLDKSGLEINNGSVAAAALKIQNGHNMMPPAYADFEYGDAYYIGSFWNPRGQGKMYVSTGLPSANKYNPANPNWKPFAGTQYMGISTLTGTSAITVWFGENATDYNIEVVPGEKYILSGYFQNVSPNNTQWNLTVKGNNGTTFTTFPIDLGGGVNQTTYTRVWTTVTVPAGVTKVLVGLSNTNTTLSKSLHMDALQFEPKVGALDTPSIWKPPAITTVHPSGITTGMIRSSEDVTINGTAYPAWSINMGGNLQVGDGLIRGRLLVGLSGDPDYGDSYISSGNFVTGSTGWKIDSAGNSEMNDGTYRGTIEAAEFIGQSIISSGSIVAGNPLTHHTEIASSGLFVFTQSPNEGLQETMRFAAGENDYFSITDATGTENVTINSDGVASFHEVYTGKKYDESGNPIGGGLYVNGDDFEDVWMWEKPWGIKAFGVLPFPKHYTSNNDIFSLKWTAVPGRTYKVCIGNWIARSNSTSAVKGIVVNLKIPSSPGGSTANSARGVIAWSYGSSPVAGSENFFSLPGIERILRCNPNGVSSGGELNAGQCEIVLSTNATTAADLELYAAGSNYSAPVWVEDIGPDRANTGAYIYEAPSTPSTQTYTSTWAANSSECYDSSGAVRFNTSDLVQGDMSGTTHGNSHGLILFTGANSTGGQTNVSLSSALSGATINKVEFYAYANHWYSGAGGTAIIRPQSRTSLVGTTPTGNYKSVSGWPRATGKWVNITSEVTGSGGVGTSLRSVAIGKAPSSSTTYYGRFNAHNQSYKPQLRVTYTK